MRRGEHLGDLLARLRAGALEEHRGVSGSSGFESWEVTVRVPGPAEPQRWMRMRALRYAGEQFNVRRFELTAGDERGVRTSQPIGYASQAVLADEMLRALDASSLSVGNPIRALAERVARGPDGALEISTMPLGLGPRATAELITDLSRFVPRQDVARIIGLGSWAAVGDGDGVLLALTLHRRGEVLEVGPLAARRSSLEHLEGSRTGDRLTPQQALRLIALLARGLEPASVDAHPPLRLALEEADRLERFASGAEPQPAGPRIIWRASRVTQQEWLAHSRAVAAIYGWESLTGGLHAARELIDEQREAPFAGAVVAAAQPERGVTGPLLLGVAMAHGMVRVARAGARGVNVSVAPRQVSLDAVASAALRRSLGVTGRGALPDALRAGAHDRADRTQVTFSASPGGTSATEKTLQALSAALVASRGEAVGSARLLLGPTRAARLTEAEHRYLAALAFEGGPTALRDHLRAVASGGAAVICQRTSRSRLTPAQSRALQIAGRAEILERLGIFDR